jgi:hypothetical protein
VEQLRLLNLNNIVFPISNEDKHIGSLLVEEILPTNSPNARAPLALRFSDRRHLL